MIASASGRARLAIDARETDLELDVCLLVESGALSRKDAPVVLSDDALDDWDLHAVGHGLTHAGEMVTRVIDAPVEASR